MSLKKTVEEFLEGMNKSDTDDTKMSKSDSGVTDPEIKKAIRADDFLKSIRDSFDTNTKTLMKSIKHLDDSVNAITKSFGMFAHIAEEIDNNAKRLAAIEAKFDGKSAMTKSDAEVATGKVEEREFNGVSEKKPEQKTVRKGEVAQILQSAFSKSTGPEREQLGDDVVNWQSIPPNQHSLEDHLGCLSATGQEVVRKSLNL